MKQVVDGGGNGSPPALDDNTATYLSTLYLYCIYKLGPCPYILDAVLEADVIANRGKSTTDCPTMSRFWKTWLSNDLEQRSKYLLSIGNGTAVANFNAVERPKYVKCKDTISKITSGESNSRYGNSGSITAAVTRTQRFIKEVQSKNIDVFSAVGVGTGAEVSSSKK